jgi:lipoprotein-anchoring transpeptidase ErfK/SrfK
MRQRRTRSRIALFGLPLAIAIGVGMAAYREPVPDAERALTMTASLSARTLVVKRGGEVINEYPIAVGKEKYPTPKGQFTVRNMVWNPSWVPPDSKWARGKRAAAPGSKNNPMKTVKIFFREPDYYIHGTGAVESLGEAASHGCLRMDPDQAAEVALLLMENAGTAKDWDWVKNILRMGQQRRVSLATPTPLIVTD